MTENQLGLYYSRVIFLKNLLLQQGADTKATQEAIIENRQFQRGLEISCKITIAMSWKIRNHLLLHRYSEFVNDFCEPKNEIILGNLLTPNEQSFWYQHH